MSTLDIPASTGQRASTFSFRLVDSISGRLGPEVTPARDRPPVLEHDALRPIKRRVQNLYFSPADSDAINPLTDLLRIHMVTGGVARELGTYAFAVPNYLRTSAGRRLRGSCLDATAQLDEKLDETYSLDAGANIATAIREFLPTAGITSYQIDGSAGIAGAAITMDSNTTKRAVLSTLAALGGYLEPWVMSSTVLRLMTAFDPAVVRPTFDYDATPVFADGIVESNDLIGVPNLFKVVDNSTSEDVIVGTYEVPASAPYSRLAIGRYVTRSESVQGLNSQTQADQAALALALQTPAFEYITLEVPPDPRHESFDVIRYRGENWLETAWSMPLVEGGHMQLQARRAYASGIKTSGLQPA